MKLNGLIFSDFYSELMTHIYNNELSAGQRKLYKVESSKIWVLHQFGDNSNYLIYEIYFQYDTPDEDYLIKKKSKLRSDSDYEEDVMDGVLIRCLERIGYKLPKEIPMSYANKEPIRAKVLMQFFMKKNMLDYYQKYERFYNVYDEEKKELILENLNRKKSKLSRFNLHKHFEKAIPQHRALIHLKNQPKNNDYVLDIAKYDFMKFVSQYYLLLSEGKYDDALNMWHPKIIYEGFAGTSTEIRRLYPQPIEFRSKIEFFDFVILRPSDVLLTGMIGVTCKVFYKMDSLWFLDFIKNKDFNVPNRFFHYNLKWYNPSLAKLKELVTSIDDFVKKANKFGINFDLENISLDDFFSPEFQLFLDEQSSNNLQKLLDGRYSTYLPVNRLYQFQARFDGKEWKFCGVQEVGANCFIPQILMDDQEIINRICGEFR